MRFGFGTDAYLRRVAFFFGAALEVFFLVARFLAAFFLAVFFLAVFFLAAFFLAVFFLAVFFTAFFFAAFFLVTFFLAAFFLTAFFLAVLRAAFLVAVFLATRFLAAFFFGAFFVAFFLAIGVPPRKGNMTELLSQANSVAMTTATSVKQKKFDQRSSCRSRSSLSALDKLIPNKLCVTLRAS